MGWRREPVPNFIHRKTDEENGSCKLLIKNGSDVSLCLVKTIKPEFHYCPRCYEEIKYQFSLEETKVWPPEIYRLKGPSDGRESRYPHESRYCYDIKTEDCFLMDNISWHLSYGLQERGIFLPGIKRFKSKHQGNYACWVYLIRMKDDVIYVGETKNLEKRLAEHFASPGAEMRAHGGYKEEIYHVKVENRELAEQLEQLLVNILNILGHTATNGIIRAGRDDDNED